METVAQKTVDVSQKPKLFNKLSWLSLTAIIIAPLLFFYPKPLLKILNPLINRWLKGYDQINRKQTRIILTNCKRISEKNLLKIKIKQKDRFINLFQKKIRNCAVLDYLEPQQSAHDLRVQNRQQCINGNEIRLYNELWAQNIYTQVKILQLQARNSPDVVVICASPGKLQYVEAKFFGLKLQQHYKVPVVKDGQLHLLCIDGAGHYHNSIAHFRLE